jgi:hypothetical protein
MRGADLAGDPKRRREKALRSAEQANATPSPQLKTQLLQLSKAFLHLSLELERNLAIRTFQPHDVDTTRDLQRLGELRDRLEKADERVAQSKWLIDGWHDLTQRLEAAGRDVSVSREMLNDFHKDLEAAVRAKENAEKALERKLRGIFVGVNRRPPETDAELKEWLASPEGKAATAFEATPLPPPAERRGRS